jgi:hypothetical protein
MSTSAYRNALELSKQGPTCVINHPDTLMVWCTPLERIAPHLRHEPLEPDARVRQRFIVNYAVRCAALGTDSRPRA